MRLLDVDTLEIEEFYGTDKPRYAILSHTWGKEEISFPDMLAIRAAADTRHPLRRKRGFHKIINTCEQARRDGYRHVWVDTCCIDKSSSSELSEAINSMFAWYQESDMCYAYLEDFSITNDFGQPNPKDTIVKSRWFSRGWTLQELLAPRRITFFHTFWESLGTKASLAAAIEGGTGISQDVLLNPDLIRNYSISERMVWATNRQTTRLEDRAYSLIGIFGVNMPLLYGEGEKAFMRLQEEIIKGSEDQTIFAWRGSGDPWFDDIAHVKEDTKSSVAPNDLGVLALSPDAFIGCGGIIPLLDFDYTRSTFMFTNRGLQINLPLVELSSGYCIGVLDCRLGGNDEKKVGIILRWTDSGVLARAPGLVEIPDKVARETQPIQVYITKDLVRVFRFGYTERTFVVRTNWGFSTGYHMVGIEGEDPRWDPIKNALRVAVKAGQGLGQAAILVFYQDHTRTGFLVRLSLDLSSDKCVAEIFAPPECQGVTRDSLRGMAEVLLKAGIKSYLAPVSLVASKAEEKYKWDGRIPDDEKWKQVLFLEQWSTGTHLRLVSVRSYMESHIILDIASTLWEIPPDVDLRSSLTNGQVWELVGQAGH